VAGNFFAGPHLDKVGVMIDPLARENVPIIEPGRVAGEMPFADHAGVIASLLEHLGNGGLPPIEAVEDGHAVDMAVFAGENGGATWSADGIDAEAIKEPHSLVGEAVKVGRLVDLAPITTHGVGGVVVRHDEK